MTKEIVRLIEWARKLSDIEWEEAKTNLIKDNQQNNSEEIVIETKIYIILKELGMPVGTKGYMYVSRAIILCLENPQILDCVVEGIYETLAKEFNSKWQNVERVIRNSIEKTCMKGNVQKIDEIFGNAYSEITGKITNSEFLAGITEYIRISHSRKT